MAPAPYTPDAAAAAPTNTAASPGSAAPEAKHTTSLYQRLGGEAAVSQAVDVFYKAIMADPEIAPFFEGVDMAKQRRKQASFMSYVFGGPTQYEGRDLGAAHRKLIREKGMTERHFHLVADHLDATLRQIGAPDDARQEAMAVIAASKAAIFSSANQQQQQQQQ